MQTSLLETLLSAGGIRMVFQPLYRLECSSGSIVGLEALARGPHNSPFESSAVLFDYIRRKRAEVAVDRECSSIAISSFAALGTTSALHINVHAATLARDPDFALFLLRQCAAHKVAPARLTIEIVEHSPAWNDEAFQESLARLRKAGMSIALDVVGLGNSNYRMMLDCHPNLFKIDAYIVNGCNTDQNRRAVLSSIAKLAADMCAEVVAEGVETVEELNTVEECGIRLVQGHLLCAPTAAENLAAAFQAKSLRIQSAVMTNASSYRFGGIL